jgi:hypothetical protein
MNKELNLSDVICSVCGSDKITYETITGKSVKIQLVAGRTIATPVYQDMEYKVCCNCGCKWTSWG